MSPSSETKPIIGEQTTGEATIRQRLALWVAFGGLAAVTALGVVAVFVNGANAKEILTMLLPVIGTWVGTVLAFYFAKDNLLAATQSTKELLGLNERLMKISVDEVMLRFDDRMVTKRQLASTEDSLSLKLLDLASILRNAERNRLPVLKADGSALYVIHLSTLTDFVSQAAVTQSFGAKPIADLTIADMKAGAPTLFSSIEAIGFVRKAASLAEAKAVLESKPPCADILVTENGRSDKPVLGWVTNVEIGLRSQV